MSEGYRPPTSARPDDKNHQQYQNQQQAAQVDRRGQYANRMRTASSGSTRGAFGLMPVDASTSNPEDIRQKQQQYDRQHVHGQYHANGQGHDNGQYHGQNKKKQLSLPTPGQSINRDSANVIRDEEHGGYGTHNNGSGNGNGGGSYSPHRDLRQRHQYQHQGQSQGQGHIYSHQPLPNHPRSQQQQQQQQYDQQQNYAYQYSNNNGSMQYSDINFSDELNNSMNYSKSTNFDYSSNSNIISDRDLIASTKLIANNMNNNGHHDQQHHHHHNPHKNQRGGGRNNDVHYESSVDGGSHRSNYNNGHGEEDGYPQEEEEYRQTWFEHLIWNEHNPEFTSLQQLVWAVFIGIAMGFFTALWGDFIEFCVEFTWKTVPEYLLEKGVFTDLEGSFPLPYYMILCPAVFGGVLSYITAILVNPKVPGQNEWIHSLHTVGVMDETMFIPVILIATAGMASGLSLGPEMPLVLSAGMIGSKIATQCKQSVLSARVMNLTAASAGIGGFFGLPMAGALFVLELPHRMGLQYFEALSPATLASIVSVIVNRLITKNEVKGMFDYPFLNESLPSSVFWVVIIYGFVGSFVGVCYAEGLLWLKHWVHEWFHAPHDDHDDHKQVHTAGGESKPLVSASGKNNTHKEDEQIKVKVSCCTWVQKIVQGFFGIAHEPTRATVAGVLVGLIVGLNCMLLPHNLFWGEAQLQTLIDRGATRLPVFGYDDEPTASMTAYGYCLVEPANVAGEHEGFSTACAGTMALTKLIIVGLSLGTGVCGGHFWAPLFVACASSHFFTDMMAIVTGYLGFGSDISAYPCLAVLCIMGSAHVVTFRAQLAIILVLTLSIGSFSAGDTYFASNGDYSAVFPLLVVACFVPLLLTRNVIFYARQCCRGDITAIPEVLCEPHKQGVAQIYRIDNMDDFSAKSDDLSEGSSYSDDSSGEIDLGLQTNKNTTPRTEDTSGDSGTLATASTSKPSTVTNASSPAVDQLSVSMHSTRSIKSNSSRKSRSSSTSRPSTLKRVNSIGKIDESNYQKPLLHQGREGASTVKKPSNGPKLPRHRRSRSSVSAGSNFSPPKDIDAMLDKSAH
jgi:H+/Cl- antiporter ClcA